MTLLYRKIDHPEDYVALQMDINSVNNWIKGNYLTFNASKCKYMLISRRRQHHCDPPELLLDNFSLERVECFKYLGILLKSDLSWSNHITSICTKARKLLGLLYRRFYKYAEPSALFQHYLSLVRPHLEYASDVWDPHLQKDMSGILEPEFKPRTGLRRVRSNESAFWIALERPNCHQQIVMSICLHMALTRETLSQMGEILSLMRETLSSERPQVKWKATQSSERPHFVTKKGSSYECDSDCLMFKSTNGLCSHSLLAASLNGDVDGFVAHYTKTKDPINYTALGQHGLPTGGKKPSSRRKASSKKQHLLLKAFWQQPMIFLERNELTRTQWLLLQQVTSVRFSLFPLLKIKATSKVLFMVSWQTQWIFQLLPHHHCCISPQNRQRAHPILLNFNHLCDSHTVNPVSIPLHLTHLWDSLSVWCSWTPEYQDVKVAEVQ